MATAEKVETISLTAGSTVAIYRFVSYAADGKVDHTGSAVRPDGVSAQAGALDEEIAVALLQGVMKVEASAAIARGALVGSAAAGKAVTAGTSANNYSAGVALDEALADGDIIRVLLHSPDRHGGT